jgi:protein phosphatase
MLAIDSVTTYVLNNVPWFFQLHEDPQDDFLDQLTSALEHCQARMSTEGNSIPTHKGMATTITLAYIVWPRLYVVHVGDSRCYLFRNSKLKQVTKDHTMAQQFVEKGVLDPEDAEKSQWSDVVWNVVGGSSDELLPEVYKAEIRIGDTVLLCTDGLTNHVSDEQISELLNAKVDIESVCHRLVDAANNAGGTDNITVVVARFRDLNEHRDAFEAEIGLDEVIAAMNGDKGTTTMTSGDVRETELVREGLRETRDSVV